MNGWAIFGGAGWGPERRAGHARHKGPITLVAPASWARTAVAAPLAKSAVPTMPIDATGRTFEGP